MIVVVDVGVDDYDECIDNSIGADLFYTFNPLLLDAVPIPQSHQANNSIVISLPSILAADNPMAPGSTINYYQTHIYVILATSSQSKQQLKAKRKWSKMTCRRLVDKYMGAFNESFINIRQLIANLTNLVIIPNSPPARFPRIYTHVVRK